MRCTRLLALSTEKVKPTGNFGCTRCGQSDARSNFYWTHQQHGAATATSPPCASRKAFTCCVPVGAARPQSGNRQGVERLQHLACLRSHNILGLAPLDESLNYSLTLWLVMRQSPVLRLGLKRDRGSCQISKYRQLGFACANLVL